MSDTHWDCHSASRFAMTGFFGQKKGQAGFSCPSFEYLSTKRDNEDFSDE